jgi:predicted Zn-dependent protease
MGSISNYQITKLPNYQLSSMLTKEQAADIFDRIRRFSSADEVEAIFTGSRFALTRFANNTIHQNVEEENSIVSIRTNFAGRTARATTNQFDDESLQRAVAASENLARVQAPDEDLLPMPTSEEAKAAGEGARATRERIWQLLIFTI